MIIISWKTTLTSLAPNLQKLWRLNLDEINKLSETSVLSKDQFKNGIIAKINFQFTTI